MSIADDDLIVLSMDIDSSDPPLEILIVALLTQSEKIHTEIVWHRGPLYLNGKFNSSILNDQNEAVLAIDSVDIARFYAREFNTGIFGDDWHHKVEVDQWVLHCITKEIIKEETLKILDHVLLVQTWIVGKKITFADIYVFSILRKINIAEFQNIYSNLTRWFKFIESQPAVQNALLLIEEHKVTVANPRRCLPQQGKFADLPGAKPGKLVVRFPPEASGYLHIGHAKAALLNQYYAELYNGHLVMRFDDTNPAKETVEFEEAILHDLELLKIKPDRFTHTSDYFEKLEQYCTTLIKNGKAFVDDTPSELMKVLRDEKTKSENRDNSVEINLQLWEEMRRGSEIGQRCCVRAKIDYESKNGCLRDPTIYRCKSEAHPRTGDKYKVYPTYDFACPLVDCIENVTHPLRTTEYEDRDDQYQWILEQFGLTKPFIVSYSRLNMTHTVLSKRKLTWFVDNGLVDGWDDPRMPTIRGILRHGMTVEALKDFIIAQGSSRSVVVMEWDKIWAFNKKVIDPVAVRYTALKQETMVKVNVTAKKELLTVPNHPKDPTKGTKQVLVGPKLLIEREDAKCLVVNQNATFINLGNLMILKINRDHDTITSVDAQLNLEDKNYKDTLKITWLAESEDEKTNPISCYAVYFDNLLSVPILPRDADFKLFVYNTTRKEELMLGEMELQRVKKGEIIQLQRKGFFICDVPYAPASSYSSREQPLILFHIPDGHVQKTQNDQVNMQVGGKKKNDKVKKLNNKDLEILNSKSSSIAQLSKDIWKQFVKVQDLQTILKIETKIFSDLKSQYKNATGQEWTSDQNCDWKPDQTVTTVGDKENICKGKTSKLVGATVSSTVSDTKTESKEENLKANKIAEEIQKQGDKVRSLKSSKADKSIIDEEVKTLLNLKIGYKATTGQDWKPGQTISTIGDKKTEIKEKTLKPVGATVVNIVGSDTKTESKKEALEAEKIAEEIQKQGDKVRSLKSSKADKSIVDQEVKILLSLKTDYKNATGSDWKPGQTSVASKANDTKTESKEEALEAEKIAEEIQKQGDKVRSLKSSKADKSIVDQEVKILLSLKTDYKNATGSDWKPGQTSVASKANDTKTESKEEALEAEKIAEEIQKQGDKVRSLKSSKADKSIVDQEVKILLSLKTDYKNATGSDWKPGQTSVASKANDTKTESKKEALEAEKIAEEIQKQGDKVRSLKSSKADKSIVDQEVKILLSLKTDYKNATGSDWKPGQISVASKANDTKTESKEEALEAEKIAEEIQKQGDKVRSLKSSKADKIIVDQEVKILLSLKTDYKNATGSDWKPGQTAAVGVDKKMKIKEKTSKPGETIVSNSSKKEEKSSSSKSDSSKKTRLGLEVKKEENFFEWYSQVITKTGMIEYYDVSGCYILRPWSFEIWKEIKKYIDHHLSFMDVQECYFPIFVTRDALEREKTHIADFAPEVAWVTKCGNSEMAEPVAIRPTSETIMYPAYAKWLRSDTELPLKLNQWNNVVRWEFKDPKPFLRTREFLWQEGHTAFATKKEAEIEVLNILDMYAFVYEKMLAVPVVKGRKTEKEKFAGGEYTTTVEAFIPTSGRAIQGATSHHLGQNFSKMFNVQVEGIEGGNEKTFVYQNSWGLTTRTIGVMIMVHGDDKGLVLPPHVAPIQAIIIPCGITAKTAQEGREEIYTACKMLLRTFQQDPKVKYRVKCDFRSNRTVGWKYSDWELKGVPVRIEIGPKEIEKDELVLVRRDTFESQTIKAEYVIPRLSRLFQSIQEDMFIRAKTELDNRTKRVENWGDFITEFNKKNLLLAPFCGESQCEDNIKADSATTSTTNDESGTLSMGAKGLCIPFKQPVSVKALDKLTCVHKLCKKKPRYYTLFGRSY